VQLHRAIVDTRPRFRLLHAKDKSPVRYDRVCEREGRPVAWSDIVKGYEYEKGRFVTLTAEDLEAAALKKTNTLDILDFVDGEEIDDRFFETPYYVLPGKGGERAYAVLREALRDTGRTGVGKIMLRQTQHLAALEAIGDALVLTMMRFPDELAELSSFRFPGGAVRDKEVAMAKTLVEQLTGKWDPEKYTDEYQANVMRLIRAKLKGKEAHLKEEPADPRHAKVVDLMERLQASLGTAGGKAAGSRRGRAAAARGRLAKSTRSRNKSRSPRRAGTRKVRRVA
jgi:DNA end-binding protein Ku